MKLYKVNVVLENREERKVVTPSLFRTMLRALHLCWICRHSLVGVSLVGGKLPGELHPFQDEENSMSKPTEAEMQVPGWLAEPITEEFWFPAEGE